MNQLKYIGLFLLCLLLQSKAQAQVKDTLKAITYNVDKDFIPVLSESIKIPVNPNPEKPEIIKPVYVYQVPEHQFKAQPTLYTIKPVSTGTMLLPKLKTNYTKLGFGNYASPLFEFYLNSVRNKNTQAGMFVKHLSANGDENWNNFSNNTIYGYVKQFAGKTSMGLDAYYHRNMINLYGIPNEKINSASGHIFRKIYQVFDTKASFQNLHKDSAGFNYLLDLGYYNYSSNYAVKENNFNVKAKFQKQINAIPFELISGLTINNTRFKPDTGIVNYNYQRIYFDFNPEIKLSDENFYLKGGFNATVYNDSNGTKMYFFPKAEGGYALIAKKLNVFVGFTGYLKPNTFRSITSENPFATSFMLTNTINRFEFYAGLKGELGPMTNFMVTGSSASISNLLFYTHDSLNGNQVATYDPDYASLNTLSATINHAFGDKFRLGLTANVYRYKLKNLEHPFSRPQFEGKVNAAYNIADKFLLKFDLFYMAQRWGATQNTVITAAKMDPFVDVNFGIDYRYNKTVSAFLNINNIANNRYQRFYLYPVYGINIMAGFTFTF